MKTSHLRVALRDVLPELTRVIDVPVECTLQELHHVLQAALGRTDDHLHLFAAGDLTYGVPGGDRPLVVDESTVRLRDLPDSFRYDLGDGWECDVERLGPGGDRPGCVAGAGSGPAGDELKPASELREFGLFDLAATDLLVRQVVGVVPESVRLVLDLAAGGVRLTPGGRLPRSFVRQIQEHRPTWCSLGRPAVVEDDLQPLAVLHDVLRDVGLLRLSKSVLTPTRAVQDDLQVVRRLRTWFRAGDFDGVLVECSVAVLLSHGPLERDELAAAVHPVLGSGWVRDGRSITVADVGDSLAYLSAEMRGLELVEVDLSAGRQVWRPGASARSLLPRLALSKLP